MRRGDRAEIFQLRVELAGVLRARAAAGPIDRESALAPRHERLDQRPINRQIGYRRAKLSPITLFAEDADDAIAAQMVILVQELDVGDLQLLAVELDRRLQLVQRRAAIPELRP